ncbi:hypothetical protein ISCGN_013868 [Ixodes scapularis]
MCGLPFRYAYTNDIRVAHSSAKDRAHLRTLFTCLADHGIAVNVSKCVFDKNELEFLGHKVGASGGNMRVLLLTLLAFEQAAGFRWSIKVSPTPREQFQYDENIYHCPHDDNLFWPSNVVCDGYPDCDASDEMDEDIELCVLLRRRCPHGS